MTADHPDQSANSAELRELGDDKRAVLVRTTELAETQGVCGSADRRQNVASNAQGDQIRNSWRTVRNPMRGTGQCPDDQNVFLTPSTAVARPRFLPLGDA